MYVNQIAKISIAPMMDWTDRHCRMLHRTLSARALLYTEMLTTGAVLLLLLAWFYDMIPM